MRRTTTACWRNRGRRYCVGVTPAGNERVSVKKAPTTATAPITAAARKAACTPGMSGAPPDAEALDMTVTNSAVPAAPATCCRVVMMALPWEYSRSGSALSASVISGVNIIDSPTIMIVCSTTSSHTGVAADSSTPE